MQFTVTQENFSKALSSVGRAASSRAGLPILANVLLRTDNNRLLIAATNLEIASTQYIGAKVTAQGEVTVPAKILSEYVSNLPKKTIEVTVKQNNITLVCDGYTSTIRGASAEEFPELPAINEQQSVTYQLNIADFKQTISQVIFACSNDATRPVLTGVLWHSFEGDLYAAGTDGYRLAERKMVKTTSNLSAIVPSSTLQEVVRLIHEDIDQVDVLFDDTQVRFRLGDNEVTSRLIDGKYPDYRQLIPKNAETHITLETKDLARTAKIAGLFAREVGGSITLEANKDKQSVSIQSVASEIGENTAIINGTVDVDGSISLNSRFLGEALGAFESDSIEITFSGKLSPITLTPNVKNSNYTHIIMPLKS